MVGEISLGVQQGLLVTLSMYQLALSQPETPLLYVQDDWIWQVAPHDKQWTKNHLRQGIQKSHYRNILQNQNDCIELNSKERQTSVMMILDVQRFSHRGYLEKV